jgi:hypothetical protein
VLFFLRSAVRGDICDRDAARRPVSVKVKQFSMQGTRIQNDWQGPQMVKYKNKLHPWKYIVVLPVAMSIKISSLNWLSSSLSTKESVVFARPTT